ncbi:hypothetical protein C3F00_038050, partial [Pseudomonas sp. MWU13-2860]
KFINIQRQLRRDWQSKLYRFLSESEYKKMVGDPIEQAESFFYRISCQGLTILGAAALGIAVFAFVYTTPPAAIPVAPALLPTPAAAPGSPQPPTSEPTSQPKLVPEQATPAKP